MIYGVFVLVLNFLSSNPAEVTSTYQYFVMDIIKNKSSGEIEITVYSFNIKSDVLCLRNWSILYLIIIVTFVKETGVHCGWLCFSLSRRSLIKIAAMKHQGRFDRLWHLPTYETLCRSHSCNDRKTEWGDKECGVLANDSMPVIWD